MYTPGRIRELKDRAGRPWQLEAHYVDDSGRRRVKTRTVKREECRTLRAAMKLQAVWIRELDESVTSSHIGGSLCDFVSDHFERMYTLGSMELSTLKTRRSLVKLLGGFPVGAMPPNSVTVRDIERLAADVVASGRSACYARGLIRDISSAYSAAVRDGLIDRNPCSGSRRPKIGFSNPNALTADKMGSVLEFIETAGYIGTAAALAMFSGLRRGEVSALRWECVDFDAMELRVVRSFGSGTADVGDYEKDPKSAAGRRRVPIAPQLLEILKKRRSAMMGECAAAGVGFRDSFYVVGGIDGSHMNLGVITNKWSRFARDAGIVGTSGDYVTFHDLRHTFATVAIGAGVDVKTVSSVMGHANAAMTLNVYASSDPNARRAAGEAIGAAFMLAAG